MAAILSILLRLLTIVLTFGSVILVHELGHFLSSRYFGARVEEFGFGLPPRICGIKKHKGKYRFFWRNKVPHVKDIDTTVYSLNFLPIGGFVKITGEDGQGKLSKKKDPKNFNSKKPWQRAVILTAGVTMNIVFAFVLFMVIFWMGSMPLVEPEKAEYEYETVESRVTIVGVSKDGPGEESGLEAGNVIKKINGEDIVSDDEFVTTINKNPEQELELTVKNGSKDKIIQATPSVVDGYYMVAKDIKTDAITNPEEVLQKDDIILQVVDDEEVITFEDKDELLTYLGSKKDDDVKFNIQRGNDVFTVSAMGNVINNANDLSEIGVLGISTVNIDKVEYTWWKVPYYSAVEMKRFLVFMPQELARVFSDYFSGATDEVPVAGPVGIAVITGRAVSFGFVMVLALMINISIALAVFNILPFPALDGGRVVFILFEKIRGKPINPKIEQRVNAIGLFILLAMAVLITVNDVSRFSDILKFWD